MNPATSSLISFCDTTFDISYYYTPMCNVNMQVLIENKFVCNFLLFLIIEVDYCRD